MNQPPSQPRARTNLLRRRENRVHPAPLIARRRRSPEPSEEHEHGGERDRDRGGGGATHVHPHVRVADALGQRKRRPSHSSAGGAASGSGHGNINGGGNGYGPGSAPSSSRAASYGLGRVGSSDKMVVDRKLVAKPRVQSASSAEMQPAARSSGHGSRRSKSHEREREREKDKDRKASDAQMGEDSRPAMYSGALAAAEFERLKKEVETLKNQLHEAKKAINKQSKVIDEMRQDKRARRSEIDQLQTKSQKSAEVLASVESSVQCLICMEPLFKPFALAPCGHIYCETCLQAWFRQAPPGADDMYDDDDPDVLLHRRKSCPTCRGDVRARPLPVFLIKSIASALVRAGVGAAAQGQPGGSAHSSPPPTEGDPWAGIFLPDGFADESSESESDSDDDDDDDDEDDEDDEDEDDFDEWESEYGYGTGPEDDGYEGPYAPARWAPPTISIDADALLDHGAPQPRAGELALLRRGATLPMIDMYNMRYSHGDGISVVLPGAGAGAGANIGATRGTVYLGWNITLHPGDAAGVEYMDWVARDLEARDDRWDVQYDPRGEFRAWRLAPGDVADEEYDTTDSEAYIDDLD